MGGVNEIEGFVCTLGVVVVVVLVNNSIFHMLYQWSERERGTWMLLPAFGTYSLSLSLSLRLTFFEILDSRLLTQYYHFIFFFFFFPPNWMTTKCRGAYPIKLGTIQ